MQDQRKLSTSHNGAKRKERACRTKCGIFFHIRYVDSIHSRAASATHILASVWFERTNLIWRTEGSIYKKEAIIITAHGRKMFYLEHMLKKKKRLHQFFVSKNIKISTELSPPVYHYHMYQEGSSI